MDFKSQILQGKKMAKVRAMREWTDHKPLIVVRTTDPDNDWFILQDVLSIVLVSPSSDQLYCVSIYNYIYICIEIMILARGSERQYQEEVVQETWSIGKPWSIHICSKIGHIHIPIIWPPAMWSVITKCHQPVVRGGQVDKNNPLLASLGIYSLFIWFKAHHSWTSNKIQGSILPK